MNWKRQGKHETKTPGLAYVGDGKDKMVGSRLPIVFVRGCVV